MPALGTNERPRLPHVNVLTAETSISLFQFPRWRRISLNGRHECRLWRRMKPCQRHLRIMAAQGRRLGHRPMSTCRTEFNRIQVHGFPSAIRTKQLSIVGEHRDAQDAEHPRRRVYAHRVHGLVAHESSVCINRDAWMRPPFKRNCHARDTSSHNATDNHRGVRKIHIPPRTV